MKLKKWIYTTITLFCLSIGMNNIISHATSEDPGAGRLSGNYIPDDFYDNDNSTSNLTINHYGSTKAKSPYTKTTYTHQTRFDNRTLLHGIDISRWQGEIDWAKVKADGIDYAFIQVGFRGYGSSGILDERTKDPYFDINMQNAIANGIRVGVYVFSQATTEAEAIEEAHYILDAISDYTISMPLVLDYEYASTDSGLSGRLYKAKLSKTKATSVCMAFCKEITDAGYTPMVYANKSMLEDELNANTLTSAGYRIWLANYTKKTTYKGTFDFWQYSEKGKINGISEDVDMNFYYAQDTDDFTLTPSSIFGADFTEVPNYTYTGVAFFPEVTVTHNGVTLTPNVDYTITYSDNQEIGTATITITGIGTYTNVKKIHFQILPDKMSAPTVKQRSQDYITTGWTPVSGVNGYEIYRASSINGTYQLVKTISKRSTSSYKDKNLTAGKCYYYKIRSYKKVGNKLYYSEFSPITAVYTKISYTRNATTKSNTVVYDSIPGTKEFIQNNAISELLSTNNTASTDATTDIITDATTDTTTDVTTETISYESSPILEVGKNTTLSVIYNTKDNKNQTWYYVSYTLDDVMYKGYVSYKNVNITKVGKVVKTNKVNVRKTYSAYSKRITTLKKKFKGNHIIYEKETWCYLV